MKWFKHLTASVSDPDFMELEILYGAYGPYVFWRTLEILAKEDALDAPLVLNERVFFAYFPSIRRRKCVEILSFLCKRKRFEWSSECGYVTIFCPKLSDISSEYTQKRRTNSGECRDNIRTLSGACQEPRRRLEKKTREVEEERDLEEEKNKEQDMSISLFEESRILFPGRKRGCETELRNLKKKHKDWKEIIPKLRPAIEIQIASRSEKQRQRQWVPEWKNFQTWINQRCWEEEIPVDVTVTRKQEVAEQMMSDLLEIRGMKQ